MLGFFFLSVACWGKLYLKMKHKHAHANKRRPHIERMTGLMCKSQAHIYMDTQSVPTAFACVCKSLFLLPCNKKGGIRDRKVGP